MKSYAALVSFGKITSEQKDEVEKLGLQMYSWDDFLELVGVIFLWWKNILLISFTLMLFLGFE